LNDLNAAEDQFESAVLLEPGSSEAQIELAKALIRQKKFADAVELLELVAGASNRDPETFELLAQAYIGAGRRQDAQSAELRAKALQKSNRPQ
jgi:predicted Zn-dependent protease